MSEGQSCPVLKLKTKGVTIEAGETDSRQRERAQLPLVALYEETCSADAQADASALYTVNPWHAHRHPHTHMHTSLQAWTTHELIPHHNLVQKTVFSTGSNRVNRLYSEGCRQGKELPNGVRNG